MPRFDGTGPLGMGAMTGGGMGFCILPVAQVPRRLVMEELECIHRQIHWLFDQIAWLQVRVDKLRG